MLPYFRKSEDNDTHDNEFHGKGGPLGVSQPAAPLPICEAFFKAAGQMGIPRNHDMTGRIAGRRRLLPVDAAHAPPFLRRHRLSCPGPRPREPDGEHQCAGHAHRRRERPGHRRARCMTARGTWPEREVVLSSGAIGSPRLLMLSGIGPADHLAQVGITAVFDQPEVGANLQDHLDLFVISECTGEHTYDRYAKPLWSAVAGLQYLLTRKGPVASSLFETGGFWYADQNARSPDIQFHLGLGSGIEAGVAAMPHGGVTLNSAYLRPRSRGTVRLASADPAAAPLIDPNYWADPHDREMSIRGLKLAREMMRQDALKPFILAERLPGPEVQYRRGLFPLCLRQCQDRPPPGRHLPDGYRQACGGRRRNCGSTASTACASPMRRSCRRSSPPTRTHRRS